MSFNFFVRYFIFLSFFLGFRFYRNYNKQIPYQSLPPYKVTIDLSTKIYDDVYASKYWMTTKNTINRGILIKTSNTTKIEIKTINKYHSSIFQYFFIYLIYYSNYDHYLILSHYHKKLISFHQANTNIILRR